MLIIAFRTFRIDNECGGRRRGKGQNIGEFCVTFRLKSTPPNSLWSHWYWRAASSELNINYFIQFSDLPTCVLCVLCLFGVMFDVQMVCWPINDGRQSIGTFVHLRCSFIEPKRFVLFKFFVFCSLLLLLIMEQVIVFRNAFFLLSIRFRYVFQGQYSKNKQPNNWAKKKLIINIWCVCVCKSETKSVLRISNM